ncbi:MAG: threonine/serine exporter family protein [Oscillospiraceae bacterium]|nr:threonine/serine exporter family protein [Oscillospiraceae bacterium]
MILIDALYAFIGSFSFGVLFNIKGKNLLFCSLISSITWIIFQALSTDDLSLPAYLISAFVAGILSEIFAIILKYPVLTFNLCGIISLVPGNRIYFAMNFFINNDIPSAANGIFEALCIAGAISIGVLFASSLITITKSFKRVIKIKK